MSGDVARKTGDRVRQAMIDAGVRQVTIAAALGISQAQVSQRLAGNVDFSISELTKIAICLSVSVTDLIPDGVTA